MDDPILEDNVSSSPYKGLDVLGFTGTQKGATRAQVSALRDLINEIAPRTIVHGDCVGADAQVHAIGMELGIEVQTRPCNISHKRAFCKGSSVVFDPKNPIARNKDIVTSCSVLVATPATSHEVRRSGTWSTIRHARRMDVPVIIIQPDGTIVGLEL